MPSHVSGDVDANVMTTLHNAYAESALFNFAHASHRDTRSSSLYSLLECSLHTCVLHMHASGFQGCRFATLPDPRLPAL
jgi:hypothetical protein